MRNLNDSNISDFNIMLDHLPVEKCGYIYDSISETINDEQIGKSYGIKMKVRLAELVSKYFSFKDNRVLLTKLMDSLIDSKYCKKDTYYNNKFS